MPESRFDPVVLNYAGGEARQMRVPSGRVVVVAVVGLVASASGILTIAAVAFRPPTPRKPMAYTGPPRVPIVVMQVHGFRYDMGRLPADLGELYTPPPDVGAARHWMGPYLESRDGVIAPDGSCYRYLPYRSADDGEFHFRLTAGASSRTHQSIDDRARRPAR